MKTLQELVRKHALQMMREQNEKRAKLRAAEKAANEAEHTTERKPWLK